jgi:hypothetical protein
VNWFDTVEIFPDHIMDSTIGDNALGWSRQGIAKESSCAEAFRKDLAEAAAGYGCTTALRATYTDIGGTVAATIGVGIVGSYQQASDLTAQFDWASDPGPMVFPVAVAGTLGGAMEQGPGHEGRYDHRRAQHQFTTLLRGHHGRLHRPFAFDRQTPRGERRKE